MSGILAKRATFKSMYETIGEVRLQEGVPKNLPKDEKRRKRGPVGKDDAAAKQQEKSAFEIFWGLQRDLHWTEIPYVMRFNRKKRSMEAFAIVGEILIHLAPSSAFNPMQVWSMEQARDKAAEEKLLLDAKSGADVAAAGGKAGAAGAKKDKGKEVAGPKLKAAEQIVADNTRKIAEKELIAGIHTLTYILSVEIRTHAHPPHIDITHIFPHPHHPYHTYPLAPPLAPPLSHTPYHTHPITHTNPNLPPSLHFLH